jgi:hypothetical protein
MGVSLACGESLPFPLHGGIGEREGHGVQGRHADEVLLEGIGTVDLQGVAESLRRSGERGP